MKKRPRKGPPGVRVQSPRGGLLEAFLHPRPSHTLQPPSTCHCSHHPSCFQQAVSIAWMSQRFFVLKPSSNAALGGLCLHSASKAQRPSRAAGHTAPACQGPPAQAGPPSAPHGLACGSPASSLSPFSLPVPLRGELPH